MQRLTRFDVTIWLVLFFISTLSIWQSAATGQSEEIQAHYVYDNMISTLEGCHRDRSADESLQEFAATSEEELAHWALIGSLCKGWRDEAKVTVLSSTFNQALRVVGCGVGP
jgi:hypothetical protein